MIAEHGVIDGVAVGAVGVVVERLVPLEEHVVGAHHVAGVDPHLLPKRCAEDVAVIHVIVTDHRACPR